MLTEVLMQIGVYIFSLGVTLINAILSPLFSLANVPYDGALGATYLFGNLGLFNTIFPIQELIFFATVAFTIKAIVFGYKVFWAVTAISTHFVNRFIRFRS